MTFGYPSAPGVVVTLDTGGCSELSNGRVQRLGIGVPSLGRLTELVKPVALKWPRVVGHIRLCGGPAPGRCWVSAYNGTDTVVATNSQGNTVATAQATQGRFNFLVATPRDLRAEPAELDQRARRRKPAEGQGDAERRRDDDRRLPDPDPVTAI